MKRIDIDGVVGLDILSSDIRAQLESAGGEDVEILISSPGGSVYEGIAVYNAIRDYKRSGGKVKARVVGLAASMATYIPLAADEVEIEDNAVWMIHNPYAMAAGDYRDMRKTADILDGVRSVLIRAYEKKTGKDKDELSSMLDDETYLYGQQIIDAGFADAMTPAGDGHDNATDAVAEARVKIAHAIERLKDTQEDTEQIAAMLKTEPQVKQKSIPVGEIDGTAKVHIQKESAMDIKALKMEHPEVFAEAVEHGVSQERGRVSELRSYVEADPDNVKLAQVVNEAISEGKTAGQVQAKLQVAMRDGGKLDGENPPDLKTAPEVTSALTEEERVMCKHLGISEDDYKKNKEAE